MSSLTGKGIKKEDIEKAISELKKIKDAVDLLYEERKTDYDSLWGRFSADLDDAINSVNEIGNYLNLDFDS